MILGIGRPYYAVTSPDTLAVSTDSVVALMAARRMIPSVAVMVNEQPTRRVEIRIVGKPPVRQIEQASGVSEVECEGPVVRCRVTGSFQPFLEALRGYEVIALQSVPATSEQEER
jgi:hypothetical protein